MLQRSITPPTPQSDAKGLHSPSGTVVKDVKKRSANALDIGTECVLGHTRSEVLQSGIQFPTSCQLM